jgi:hypothetical protein
VADVASESDPFRAETRLARGLRAAREAGAFDLMPEMVLALADRRMARLDAAIEAARLTVVEESFEEEEVQLVAGFYLLRPPLLVGADARRIRLMAIEQSVPVLAVCHEPITGVGLCPLVAIAPGATIRTKVRPPADWADAEAVADWLLEANEALGDRAVDLIDGELAAIKRLDQLLDRLDAIPEHRELHEAIAAIIPEVIREAEEDAANGGRRRRSRKAG